MAVLEVQHLKKIYTTRFGGNRVQALSDVGFSVEQGEYVAIMGESGSGKTTLLNILAALDRPTSGSVLLDGTDLSTVKESGLAAFRLHFPSGTISFFRWSCPRSLIWKWSAGLRLLQISWG